MLLPVFGHLGCEDSVVKITKTDTETDLEGEVQNEISEDTQVEISPEDTAQPDIVPEVATPPQPASVETQLPVESVAAGTLVGVTCIVLSEEGEQIPDIDSSFTVHPSSEIGINSDNFTPNLVGEYEVSCRVPALGLIDMTPARLDVVPGPAVAIYTSLSRDQLTAGESATVTCTAVDSQGNLIIDADYFISMTPASGTQITYGDPEDPEATPSIEFQISGTYEVSCELEGGVIPHPDSLRVVPGLPSLLSAAIVPRQEVYRIGQVVTLQALVVDQFGNPVPSAELAYETNPVMGTFGTGRFRPLDEGIYELTLSVISPTYNDVELSWTGTLIANEWGPSIECLEPLDASILIHTPGDALTFRGRVSDSAGVELLRINYVEMAIDENGTFSTTLTPDWGVNFVNITARDTFGEETSTFCAFMISQSYFPEGEFLDDVIMLRMNQAAIDDGGSSDPILSLGDILRRVVESNGIVTTIDQQMSAQNPIYPENCEVEVWLIGCVFRLRVDYRSFSINGVRTVSLNLVDGGLRARIRLDDIEVGMRIGGTVSTNGTVSADNIIVDMTFGVSLNSNHQPVVSVSNINEVTIGDLHVDFSGIIGAVIDLIAWIFENTIRSQITSLIRDFLRDNLNAVLQGVLQNLDVSSLGAEIPIPSFTGGRPTMLGFNVRFSSINLNSTRALFGMGSLFTGSSNHVGDSPGSALPPGSFIDPLNTTRTTAAGINLGLLNQVLHVLWRTGMLDFDAASEILGIDAPEGTEISFTASMPPVAIGIAGQDNKVAIHLGGVSLTLLYPGFFDEPLSIRAGVIATSDVTLSPDNELSFSGIAIDEFYFAAEDMALDGNQRAILESMLTDIFQEVLDTSINSSLPALPIPEFELPSSLGEYGFDPGTAIGLRNGAFTITESHFLLEGDFRE